MADEAQEATPARELLAIYLHDHRAGAAAGLQLVRRCRHHAGAGELASTLAWLEGEIEEEQRTLDSIMDGLEIHQSPLKTALGVAAERAGRLKLNGRLWKRSPLSTLVELEALAAAVYTKRNLWQSLAAVADQSAVGDSRRLVELIDRATIQLERVQAYHDAAARHAFDAAATGFVDEPRSETTTQQAPGPTARAVVSQAPEHTIDRLLQDAEGGVEGSALDLPADADGTSI